MITKNLILSKLPPYTGSKKVLIDEQNTDDIIKGILDNHEVYKNDYDKISEYFVGRNDINTAKNVYTFLKKYVPYYIESTKFQTLRSPSAIISIKQGADCKSYASFVNGIFDSLNRKGIFNIPLAYRFASYKNSKNPGHVFSVLYPGSENEIWVDNVLDNFNEKKQPTYFKDKKLKMALVSMSGLDNKQPTLDELKNYRDKLISIQAKLVNNGQIVPGNQNDLQMKVAINRVTKAIQNGNVSNIGDATTDAIVQASGLIPIPGLSSIVSAILPFVADRFGSPAKDANNLIDKLKPYLAQADATKRLGLVLEAGKGISDRSKDVEAEKLHQYYRNTYPEDYKSLSSDEKIFYNKYLDNVRMTHADGNRMYINLEKSKFTPAEISYSSNVLSNLFTPSTNGTNKAGISPWILVALAGAGIYFFTRKK